MSLESRESCAPDGTGVFQPSAAIAQTLDANLAAGVPHALVMLRWAGHAFDFVNFNTPGAPIVRYAITRFLASVTR